MKRIHQFLIVCVFVFAGMTAVHANAASIAVTSGGKAAFLKGSVVKVKYNGTVINNCSKAYAPAIKIASTVYVPCKTVFCDDGIRASYVYNPITRKVTVISGSRKVSFRSGSKKVTANGTSMKVKKSPFFTTFTSSGVRDLMVPARYAADYLGLKYSYDSASHTVYLSDRGQINLSATKVSTISKSAFISNLGPIARRDYKNTGVLASVTLAQAILESGWGQSYLSEKANNLFGMKRSLSGNNWGGSSWDGFSSKRKGGSSYRKYSCAEDSIADHSAYLTHAKKGSHLRYSGLTKTKSYRKQLRIIARGGYCSSGAYVSQLSGIIRRYHLTKYDK